MRYDVNIEAFHDGASRAHLIRYYVARGCVEPGDKVIDAACGTGYGSELLSRVVDKVYSFDQLDSIKYKGDINNIEYQKVNLEHFKDFPEADVGISLETIEHLPYGGAKRFMGSLLSKLKRFFIFSVPLNEVSGANPFHKQTFNESQAWEMVNFPGWKPFHTLMQGNHLMGVLYRSYL